MLSLLRRSDDVLPLRNSVVLAFSWSSGPLAASARADRAFLGFLSLSLVLFSLFLG